MKTVVSFSGGRTSAYLCSLIKERMGDDVEFIFFNTGGEHPKTYDFIRKCNDQFNLNLTCLEVDINHDGMGKRHTNSYKIVDINSMHCDLAPFIETMAKYGRPSFGMASCTREMKSKVSKRYLDEKYGKGEYQVWLGIRADEPARFLSTPLVNKLSSDLDYLDFKALFCDMRSNGGELGVSGIEILTRGSGHSWLDDAKEMSHDAFAKKKKESLHFLAELSDFDKHDVIQWWRSMPFDLEIEEHLGNCVFCVKKSVNKVALAARDEPELLASWKLALDGANNRDDLTNPTYRNGNAIGVIYRGGNSIDSIVAKYENHSRDEIRKTIRSMRQEDSGSCGESCEAFNLD